MALSLRLFGRFELTADSGVPIKIPGSRSQLVLALLAMPAGSAHDRVRVSSLFWGERQDQQARASLRQAIWTLRQALAKDAPSLLQTEGAVLNVDAAQVQVDVAEFEARTASTALATLREAAELYRGDLLEEFDLMRLAPGGPFLELRERLRERALDCFRRVVDLETRDGRYDEAADAARRALRIDPLREDVHRALITLHMRRGRLCESASNF